MNGSQSYLLACAWSIKRVSQAKRDRRHFVPKKGKRQILAIYDFWWGEVYITKEPVIFGKARAAVVQKSSVGKL